MKFLQFPFFISLIALALFIGCAKDKEVEMSTASAPPHLEMLDLTTEEYRALNAAAEVNGESVKGLEPHIVKLIDAGEKLFNWIDLINANRDENHKIRLTSKNNRSKGTPIESANKYGPSTLLVKFNDIMNTHPQSFRIFTFTKKELTSTIPKDMNDESFIKYAQELSRAYDTSVRWKTVILPWKAYYSQNKIRDIRAFYQLKKVENIKEKLVNFTELTSAQQDALKINLIGICLNTSLDVAKCEKEFREFQIKFDVFGFYQKYLVVAQNVWDSYFKITNPRKDIEWKQELLMELNFSDPKDQKIADFLKVNIEDEFKWGGWVFNLNFIESNSKATPSLRFEPNVTPHVADGWNVIVMDKNSSIEEYENQWTIRHEFGHILRLPDCYTEFFDEKENLAVNYQLDVNDLMCSRAGNFTRRMYDELKRVYFNDLK
jgi:hypothetical protein